MQQEVDLFRYKLQKFSAEPYIIQRFLTDNNLEYLPVIIFLLVCLNNF